MKKLLLILLPLFSANLTFSQVNLNSGLVAYYPFNGNANDASGNGNNPIFNNATLTTDRFGNPNSAYSFNGIDNYIQIPNSPSLNFSNQMSIALKIKPLGYYTGPCYNNMMIMKGDADYLPGNYFIRFSDILTGCTNPTTTGEQFYGAGLVATNPIVQLNQWYDVVWTYDGTIARIYVNCVLQDSTNVPLAPLSNTYDLFLGHLNNAQYPYWLNGVLDEVRIYNRPLNKDEVNAYSDCLSFTDSTIINDYTPVLGLDICKNELKVADATKYNPGDTVLIIQMKGATIDSTNTAVFGNIINYNNSGNYEMNIVKQKNGNSLALLNVLKRQYDIPNGKVQLIRVPYFTNYTVSNTLTCLPWNGTIGGVLVLNVRDTTFMDGNIDVTGKGFRGGRSPNPNTTTLYCNYNDYYYPLGTAAAAGKGESIANIGDGIAWGKGSPANGGGGGNGHNSGGGGGSNGGVGGFGGYQLDACGGSAIDNRGLGGKGLTYSNAANKIFMGGGGGSGHTDNAGGSPMNGGNGGGIVIVRSAVLKSGGDIIAKGGDAPECNLSPIALCHDGSGGGGGAGTVLLENSSIIPSIHVDTRGGKGADLVIYSPPGGTKIGPGGGGGAGVCWTNANPFIFNIMVNETGGVNGVIIPLGNDPYGTTAGQAGIDRFNLKIPVDTILFKPNIDSVRIKDNATSCNTYDFKGFGYTNTSAINSWEWSFGDGTADVQQNTSHSYVTSGTYTVKLVVTDINGCKDSITTSLTTSVVSITKSNDTSLCGSLPVQLQAGGGSSYTWTPVSTLSNPNIPNPIATPLTTTIYHVTVTNAAGCSKTDSVKISVNSFPVISKSNDTSICQNTPVQLNAGGGSTYSWTPASTLANPNISNPIATPGITTWYHVVVTNASGCSKTDSVLIRIDPLAVISKSNDTTICSQTSVRIFANGGTSYLWSPASSLDNPISSNPVASPATTTLYKVAIKDMYSCSYEDSVKVSVRNPATFTVSPDAAVCSGLSKQLQASGGDTYIWSPTDGLDNPNSSSPLATPLNTTTYTVTIHENSCNETGNLSTIVTVLPLPAVNATSSNDLSCSIGSSQLNATGATSYTWSPAAGLNNNTIANPIATPSITTLYTVAGKDNNGCINSDTVTVKADFNMNALYLLPNSFTPNGDGINDCFGIKYWGVVQDLDFRIYNRFGNMIFHTTDPNVCWDGRYKQQLQDANVFVYIITAKTACGTVSRKGTVTLLK